MARRHTRAWLQLLGSVVACLGVVSGAAALDIVTNGQPAATIVVPDEPLPVVSFAAEELQYHVERASGPRLLIVKEAEIPGAGGLILLGSCRAAEEAGLSTDDLPPNGFILKLMGDRFFMLGDDSDGPAAWILHNNRTRIGTLFAVYEFLEKHLDVRWLWPGELGEVIPRQTNIAVDAWDQTGEPAFVHTRWRDGGRSAGEQGWSSGQARSHFLSEQGKWLRRHRFALGVNMDIRHAFTKWWEQHADAHPEYFNLLPDGTRRPDPTYHAAAGELISMSVAEPAFWRAIVEHWQETRSPENPYIDASENDTSGKCTCQKCLAWDVLDPELEVPWAERLERAKRAFEAGETDWHLFLGSLSDRYARFYLAVQAEAEKIDPEATVLGFAYANYVSPPRETKLNDRIILGVVPPMYFPWTGEKRAANRQQWDGWAATGARLLLRPNFMLDGHNMPLSLARKLGEDFRYYASHGMIGTDFDSLTGQYGTQGPNLYVLARLHNRPGMTTEQVLDEYFRAFGAAEAEVRAYFAHWEAVCDAVAEPPEGLHWASFYREADSIFTPEAMAEGRRLLEAAARAAEGDGLAARRVEHLQKGLRNAELTLAAQVAYRRYREAGDIEGFRAAIQALDDFRASVEGECLANMAFLAWTEARTWDRELLRLMAKPGERISDPWRFRWDPDKEGERQGWFADELDTGDWLEIGTDGPWEEQAVGRRWREERGEDYNGVAWYRNSFQPTRDDDRPIARLVFGAVDEACIIWVNGEKVLERPYPYQGNPDSWQEAFDVDVTDIVRLDRPNTVAVRVEDNAGAGGVWRPVWLVRSARPAAPEQNAARDGGFEERPSAWKQSIMCGTFQLALDEREARTGRTSARIECTGLGPPEAEQTYRTRAWGRWYQTEVAVDSERTYRLRVWVKTSRDSGGKLAIWVTGDRDRGTAAANVLSTQGIWQEVTVSDIHPKGEQVGIYLNLMDGAVTAWFDDVELVAE